MATASIHPAPRMTAERLLELPDDGMRHELVEGQLRTMPLSGGVQGLVGATLLVRMYPVVVSSGSGGELFAAGTGFVLGRDPDTLPLPELWA